MSDPTIYEQNRSNRQLLFDACKHVSTLSTASIVLILALVEKYRPPETDSRINSALIGLSLALLFSMGTMAALIMTSTRTAFPAGEKGVMLLAMACFLYGLFHLAGAMDRKVWQQWEEQRQFDQDVKDGKRPPPAPVPPA